MPRPPARPLVCALAYAGIVAAYLPLLGLLLPLRIEAVAGASRFALLATVTATGAIVAGGANLLFGWASDHGHARRRWIAGGLAGTLIAYAALGAARSPVAIVAAIMLFQAALNAMLAPLLALIAEEVPDRDKGLMSGLLAGAQPAASLLGPLLVMTAVPALGSQLLLVGLVVTSCIMPLLLTPAGRGDAAAIGRSDGATRADLALAVAARLLVQVAGNVLSVFLLFFMEGFVPASARSEAAVRVGRLLLLASLAPWPVALLLGRWSDRIGRRKPFLVGSAALAAAGLAAMGGAGGWPGAALGYCLFSVGWNAFLSLQVGLAMEVLPDPARRGRDLGLLNLANTVPALIGQALAWLLATPRHPAPLLFALAGLTLAGGIVTLGIRGRR